ncbi:MAG: DNA replication/repair protein RecF [Bacillota bacterium]|nr:DNA replication/repair protein RecF [Bacillota bacterium]
MYVESLKLNNFRNYYELNMNFTTGVNILIGDNAQGKTNILESIYYCSIGKSHRTNKDKELINWQRDESYIKLHVGRQRLDKNIEIKIFKDGKKGIKINSIKINKLSELIGVFNAVMFSPEDLKIVKESPANRRKFLDIELCKLDNKYYYNLVKYNKVLDERNTMLKKWNSQINDVIDIYDEQLSEFGAYIIKERMLYIKKLNLKGKKIHDEISSGIESIKFKYLSCIKEIEVSKEDLKSQLKEQLIKNRSSDIEKRGTSIGPHREDFSILINNVDVKSFGSQGQQRTAVLTIKFSSLEIIKDIINEYPVLLLDDVLSELDINRQKYILNSIKNVQTIITCTGIDSIREYLDDDVKVFNIKNGMITNKN